MFKKIKNEVIFTCHNNFKELAKNELLSISNNGNFIEWLADNIGYLKYNDNYDSFMANVSKKNLIFSRHIQPVNFIVQINNAQTDIIDIIKLKIQMLELMNKTLSFSIQIRMIGDYVYSKLELLNKLNEEFLNENITLDNKNPQQIISILIKDNSCFIGISKDNLSKWSGGECRYSEQNIISRAELKLEEILEHTKLDLNQYKNAVDLGCSPGGWSKILLKYNLKVVGVDPADVDSLIRTNLTFIHYKNTIENFLEDNKENFDIICNDMKMNVEKSIKMICKMSRSLNKNGIIILTIKLFKNNDIEINNIINSLKSNFNIIFARQLFYNRNEFSVVLKLK